MLSAENADSKIIAEFGISVMELHGPRNTANLEGKITMDDMARKEGERKDRKERTKTVGARKWFRFGT